MTRRCLIVLLLMSVASGSSAHAADCLTAAADQRAMADCVAKGRAQADTELNADYNRIVQRLKTEPEMTKLLIGSQRAWIAFRDAECGFANALFIGGTLYPIVFSACVERLTRRRIEDLQTYLSCKDTDSDCPVPSK